MAFYKSAEVYYAEMTSTMTDVDVSKYSLIYNSLMPCAYELSYQSQMLDEAVKMVFASTALANGYDDYVILRCSEKGLTRKIASTATSIVKVQGVVGYTFPSGALVSTSLGLTYTTDSALTLTADYGYINITASGEGSSYNAGVGEINSIPVKYEGISSVTNEVAIDDGYDIESISDLYARYLVQVQNISTSANPAQYKEWALSVDGIKFAECYPTWAGAGTVKIVCANSNKRACDAELIANVQTYIESVRPICSGILTVESVTEVPLNISFTLLYDSTTYTLDTVKSNITDVINTYLNTLDIGTSISYNKIGALILSAAGTTDYSNLLINGTTSNISLNNTEVATIGEVSPIVA